MKTPLCQAVIYSVQRWAYHGMEMPPEGGVITPEMLNERTTLHGVLVGYEGTECCFPRGYENFQILDVSNFMTRDRVDEWIVEATKRLNLPQSPRELSDLAVGSKAA